MHHGVGVKFNFEGWLSTTTTKFMFLHGFLYVWLIFPHKVDFHPHSRQQLLLCKKENRGNDELPVLLLKIYKKNLFTNAMFCFCKFWCQNASTSSPLYVRFVRLLYPQQVWPHMWTYEINLLLQSVWLYNSGRNISWKWK